MASIPADALDNVPLRGSAMERSGVTQLAECDAVNDRGCGFESHPRSSFLSRQPLDKLQRRPPGVMPIGPPGQLARPPRIARSPSARSTASRSTRGETNRRGTRTPAPAQSSRAAFSFMSPTAGQATTAHPEERARTRVPCPAWQTTRSQRAWCASRRPSRRRGRWGGRAASAGAACGCRWRAPARARGRDPRRAARSSVCWESWAVEGAMSTSGASDAPQRPPRWAAGRRVRAAPT